MKLKMFIKSMRNRKVLLLLMTFQLTISFYAFVVTATTALDTYNQFKFYRDIFDVNKIITIDTASDHLYDPKGANKVYEELLKLKSSGSIKNIKLVVGYGKYFEELRYINGIPKDSDGEVLINYECVSKEFMDNYKLKVMEGREFQQSDFDRDTVKSEEPIIVGSGYSGYLKVGDILTEKVSNPIFKDSEGKPLSLATHFKVVGIAEKDNLINFYVNKLTTVNLDNYAIYKPFSKVKVISMDSNKIARISEADESLTAINGFQYYIEISNENEIDSMKEKINSIFNKYGYHFIIKKQSEESFQLMQQFKSQLIEQGTFSIIITIFSLMGVIGTTVFSIKKRHKEFGIKISQGGTISNIAIEILGEVLLMNSIALACSAVASYYTFKINHYVFDVIQLIPTSLKFAFVIFFISTLFTVSIPLLKMRKLSPVDLMRGDI